MNATGTLRRVLLRPPRADELANWEEYGWREEPDPGAIAQEHEELCGLLSEAGAEVVLAEEPVEGDPDAIYAYDPVLLGPNGAFLLRIGKPGRLAEADALLPALTAAGILVAGRMEAPATADGGDMFWLDEQTLLVGRGYRTNNAGIAAIRASLLHADVIAFDLPHMRGRSEVLHLMSLVSPLDDDLVVAFTPLLPVRLVELFEERGIEIVDVPSERVRQHGRERARARAACGARARRQRGDAASARARRRDGAGVRRRRAVEGRRRADVPDAPATSRLTRGRWSTASAGVAARGTPSTCEPRLEDHDRSSEDPREADLGQRAVRAADGDHGVARRRDDRVPRVPEVGQDDVVDPFVRVRAARPRQDPDRRAAGRLRSARRGRHHLAETAADDRAAALRQEPAHLLGARPRARRRSRSR